MHSLTRSFTLGLVIGALATLACAPSPDVRDLWFSAGPPIPADRAVRVGASVAFPPDGASYRWSSDHGEFDPPETDEPETFYTSMGGSEAGRTDRILLEILDRGSVVAEAAFEVEVTASLPRPAGDERVATPVPATDTHLVTTTTPAEDRTTRVRITTVPIRDPIGGPDTYADIAGSVSHAPSGARVVLYACTDRCYVQPLISSPFTRLDKHDRWSTWTHTGRDYLAFVVGPEYSRPPFTLASPTDSLPGAIASTIVEGIPAAP